MITITDKAKTYLISKCQSSGNSNVKLTVKGGGCAGFSYDYTFSNDIDSLDIVVGLDDNHNFLIDGTSVMYVIGTTLDYIDDLSGSALKLSNPNETSSCGCGKSFSV